MEAKSGHVTVYPAYFLYIWIATASWLNGVAYGAMPYFLRQPSNQTVRMGTSAVEIQCAVAHKQTAMSWVKDGFGLDPNDFDDPRHSISGSPYRGEYNLQIVNVDIKDDGMYSCQFMPDYRRGVPWLKSRLAYLNVLVPPKKMALEPAVSGIISVVYPEKVSITCSTPDTKPASTISWQVGGRNYAGVVNEKVDETPGSKLVTSSSTIVLQPDKIQNGSTVECIVKHPAMDATVSSIATLNVMYPPNAPRITEFDGRPIKSGDEITMKCKALGGNPHARITWAIGDEVIYREFVTTRGGSESVLRHIARPQDHGKTVTCRAESPALKDALEASETLEVYYPPEKIILDQEPAGGARENGILTFTCHYAHSNPPATLQWTIDGKNVPTRWSESTGLPMYLTRTLDGDGFAAKTSLTLTSVRRQDANMKIACRASSPLISYVGEVSAHPKVNYPAREVEISVFHLGPPVIVLPTKVAPSFRALPNAEDTEDLAFKAGDTIQLICQSRGGNPPPDLRWYRDGVAIVSGKGSSISAAEVKVYTGMEYVRGAEEGEYVTSTTLEIKLDAGYNGNAISCEAGNGEYPATISDSKELKVVFPPKTLTIEQFPSTPVAGKPMSLTCTTSASFPAAKITWYRDNREIETDWSVDLPTMAGSHNGFTTSSRLQLIADFTDDGSEIVCRAEIESIRESVSQPYRVRVEYPPVFVPINARNEINVTEGDAYLETEGLARANPREITYTWYRFLTTLSIDGRRTLVRQPLLKSDRVTSFDDRGYLRIGKLHRKDGGLYQVRASNAQGSSEMNITINVFYPASIIDVSGPDRIVKEGETVELSCDFDTHPLAKTRVEWLKEGPGRGRASYDIRTQLTYSVLTLYNATAHDRGLYKCNIQNGYGKPDSAQVNLQMLYKPFFVDSSPSKVAVSAVGADGTLTPPVILPCVANSRPDATFTWMRGNGTIVPSSANGYSITHDVLDFETAKSSLRVKKVSPEGRNAKDGTVAEYTCIASNSGGRRIKSIEIVLRGQPDPPTQLTATNMSYTSLILSWKNGFDGGSKQSFTVQYQRRGSGKVSKVQSDSNHVEITGLDPNAEYKFTAYSSNLYGKSAASKSLLVKTEARPELPSQNMTAGVGLPRSYVISFAVIGGLIFFLIFAVILFTVKRCNVSRNSYRPKTIEGGCDSSGQPESVLSSIGSTKKRPVSAATDDRTEEHEQLTASCGTRSDNEEMRVTPTIHHENGSAVRDFHQSSYCCSLPRCGSSRQYEGSAIEYGPSSTIAFPSSRYAVDSVCSQFNRFGAPNHSTRSQTIAAEPRVFTLPRSPTEPAFRQDVAPSSSFSGMHSSARNDEDPQEKMALLQSNDLPLPPSLPLYDRPQYSLRPTRPSNDALNAYSYSGTDLSSENQGFNAGSQQCRPYKTLQVSRFGQARSPDCCSTMATPFGQDQSACIPTGASACLYNVVSRPGATRTLSSSLSSMQSATDYAVNVVGSGGSRDRCTTPQSASGSSVLYVKSMENVADEPGCSQTRPRHASNDGFLNTFGYDPSTVPTKEYRPSVLNVIRESHSQDNLPTSSLSDAENTSSTSAFRPTGFPGYGRSSFREMPSRHAGRVSPFGAQRRGVTPPLRYRDELSRALSGGSKSTASTSAMRRPEQHTERSSGREHSDTDTDSGCGGSADAVVVDSDLSPQSPDRCRNTFPRRMGLSAMDDQREGALFV